MAVHPPQRGHARRRSKVSSKKTFRHGPEEYDVLLATDLVELAAETVAMLYRWRWTIELFFRWFKCVLGFSHLVLEGQGGVAMQVYCALIVSLLVVLWTGVKRTKRTWEMIQLYFQGWASLDELESHLAGLRPVQVSQS
ncbi:MAG: transposase [Alphaproteobacteria bacterium]